MTIREVIFTRDSPALLFKQTFVFVRTCSFQMDGINSGRISFCVRVNVNHYVVVLRVNYLVRTSCSFFLFFV